MKAKRPIIWLARCDEIFGGYGLVGVGATAAEAKRALWKKYQEVSPGWNRTEVPASSTFKEFAEYWGINVTRYRLGEGYFGDGSAEDPR